MRYTDSVRASELVVMAGAVMMFSGSAAVRGPVSLGASTSGWRWASGSRGAARVGRRSVATDAVAVFGATGLTGRECTWQLLEKGVGVVALCRDPSRLCKPKGSCGLAEDAGCVPIEGGDKLVSLRGDVTKLEDVQKVFSQAGQPIEGVIVSLGGKTKDVGETMLTDGTRNVIEAAKAAGVKRVTIVTSIGAGDSKDQAPFFFKVLMGTVMKAIFDDKNNQEALFLPGGPGNGLEWCIVRPGGLTVDPPTGVVNVIEGEAGSIPRADVASFCIGAVLDKDFPYIGQAPCISSTGGTSWTKDRSSAARGGA